MKITWLGHGSFRVDIADQVLLIDPWLYGNPVLDEAKVPEAVAGATQILVTHGHFDHTKDLPQLSKDSGLPVSGGYELIGALVGLGAVEGNRFNVGGTVAFGDVQVSMVPASHSSSMEVDGHGTYMGQETGFIIKGEGRTIYHSGDTSIMADMAWIGDYYKPDIGILSAGGYFTMDMDQAAYAARRYFDFKQVIPGHYRTFPILEQSVEALRDGLPGVEVCELAVMEAREF